MGEKLGTPRDWYNPRRKRFWALAVLLLYTLAGFFLAPWLVQRQLIAVVGDTLKRPVAVEHLAINPFALSAEARGFRIDEQNGSALVGFDRLYINFQLSSLFNLAWTFRNVELNHPYGELILLSGGDSNFSRLLPESAPADDESSDKLAPLIIQHLAIEDGEFHFTDARTGAAKRTTITPISLSIHNLSTREGDSGEHSFEARAENDIRLSWQGSVQLNPLNLEGKLQASGAYLPLAYRFVDEQINAVVDKGDLNLELDYRVAQGDAGIAAAIEQLQLNIDNLQVSDKATEKTVVDIAKLKLANLNLSWPEKTLNADSLAILSGELLLHRDSDGVINAQTWAGAAAASPGQETTGPTEEAVAVAPAASSAPQSGWQVALNIAEIRDVNLKFSDASLRQPAQLEIADLDATLSKINNRQKNSMPLTFAATLASGGAISAQGEVILLPEVDAQLQLTVADLNLVAAQPYISEYAAMTLESGAVAMDARILSNPQQVFAVEGELAVNDLRVVDTARKRPLLGWQTLTLKNAAFSTASNSLDINAINAEAPYARLRIAQDQTTNFQKLLVTSPPHVGAADGSQTQAGGSDGESEKENPTTAPKPFTLSIGQIDIREGSGDFADRSLPIPFDTNIANINGKITTIDTSSTQPASVELEGQVNDYGLAKIGGTLLPLGVKEQADIKLLFRNLELPDLTPYSIKFAGREIANGRMNLDLRYLMDQGKLKAQNNIVISDLELGKKVDYEGALDLPLGLAIALLTDASGKIDIDLPVEGDTNNPEFRLGSIIGKVFVNLISKAVTAPFRLLGALVGMESTDFERIEFEPGLATLTPPEKEKIAKLAAAMAKRPQLGLRIAGVVHRDADTQALKTLRVESRIDGLVQQRLEENPQAQVRDLRLAIVESLMAATAPDVSLDDLRGQFIKSVNSETPDGDKKLDASAYAAELRKRLVAAETLSDADLDQLAMARAENLKKTLIDADGSLGERVATERGKAATLTKNGWVPLRLKVDSL